MVAPVVVLAPATGLFKSPPDDATSCFDDLFLRDEGRLRRVKYSITPPYTKLAITMMTPMYASSPLPNRRSKKSITLTTNQLNEGTKGRKKGQVKLVKQRQPATGNGLSSSRASSCGRCGSSHVGFCGWCSRFKERGGRGRERERGRGEKKSLFLSRFIPFLCKRFLGHKICGPTMLLKPKQTPEFWPSDPEVLAPGLFHVSYIKT